MQENPDFDPQKVARSLLRRSRQGALATLKPGSGDPYCSLVSVASHVDGSPILLISRLAIHTQNLLADSRVSLMLDERSEGDPLSGARLMLAGWAEQADSALVDVLRERYLRAHPSAEVFVSFKDFLFVRIRPRGAHLVAGFGRIVDLSAAQLLSDVADAASLLEAEASAVAHLNEEHQAALKLYATCLLGADAADWRCTGCDPDGIDLQAGMQTLRLEFPRRIVTPAALRQVLHEFAQQARNSTGP